MGERSGVWLWNLAAIVLFGTMSWAYLDHGASLTRDILGTTTDPTLMIGFLAWWPWAVLHHAVHWYTYVVLQLVGQNLAWTTSVPLLALLRLPATLLGGSALAYNLLILGAPVLGALSAYFLCLDLFTAHLAALIGGGRVSSATLFGGLLALQFYISLEVAATLMVFGGIAWVYAMGKSPDRRVVLRRLFVDGVFAGLMTGMFCFPFLFHIATTPRLIWVPLGWTYMTSALLYNLFVTMREIVFGLPPGSYKSSGLFGLFPQYDFTTGLPLIAIVVNYFFCNRKLPAVRVTFCVLITLLLASLGPQLWIGNHFSNIILPWRLMLRVPLINAALPERFTLYSSLLVSIIVALWISGETRKRQMAFRSAFALFAWVVTLSPLHKTEAAPYSAFFRPGRLEEILGNDPRVLILPGKDIDASTFWQAENNFGFVQEGGYLGMPPSKMLSYPAVRDLIIDQSNRKLGKEVKAFCLATDTSYVLAGPGTNTEVLDQLEALSWPFRKVDDVLIFTVPRKA